ncbi:MAG: peroxidase-related enzyme [Pseudonocardiaceae bacterium]
MIRLPVIERGRGLRTLALRPVLRWFFGCPIPGFVKVLLYRHEFFGKPLGRYGQAVLRGPSRWSVAERELFAALVSVGNQCGYCAGVHCSIAGVVLGTGVVDDVVHDRDPGRAGPRVAAMVPFLHRLSARPDRIATGDVLELRTAGLDDAEILDAVHAAVLLEICNRVVNALGVEPMGPAQNRRAARFLLHHGYDL